MKFYEMFREAPKLESCLDRFTKDKLQKFANQHNCDLPEDVTQDQMLVFLGNALLQSFSRDLENNPQLRDYLLEAISFAKVDKRKKSSETQKRGEDIPLNVQKMLDLAYCFSSRDHGVVVPREFLLLYKRKRAKDSLEGERVEDIQFLITVATNLYGYCEIKHVLKMYEELLNGSCNLKKIEDYIQQIFDGSDSFEITDDQLYIYHRELDEDDLQLFVEYDSSWSYYIPNDEELHAYQCLFSSPKELDIWHNMFQTCLGYVSFDYKEEHLLDFITLQFVRAAKLGYGIRVISEILAANSCKLRERPAILSLYWRYIELDRITRKWFLKGHLLSELEEISENIIEW